MDFKKWKTHRVKSQGDCLFDSIRIALQSIGYKYKIVDLRHAVAKRVLDGNDNEMKNTIDMWIELYKQSTTGEKDLLFECFQVAEVVSKKKKTTRLTYQDRFSIYNNMMTSMFWGEETTLRTLERSLYTRFLIFYLKSTTEDGDLKPLPMQPTSNGEIFPYDTFIVLFLNGNHYQPMSHEGKFVFLKDSLPDDVTELFKIYIA